MIQLITFLNNKIQSKPPTIINIFSAINLLIIQLGDIKQFDSL